MFARKNSLSAIGAGALALAAGLGLAADMARAEGKAEKLAVYSSVGPRLAHWDLDTASAALASRGTVALPANVQYAVAHPNGRFLYVASSNGTDGDKHHVSAFRIGKDGALEPHGEPTALPHRPIHVTTDRTGAYLLLAFNKPRTVMVYKIDAKGGIGAVVIQPTSPDGGFFVHQVRVDRSNRVVLTAALGADAGASGPEQIGKLTTYNFKDGTLALKASVVPGPGLGPRHVDFHPTRPLVFAAIERGNKLHVHQLQGGALGEKPLFAKETLKDPAKVLPKQRVGAIHVHPNGRFVYLTNRNDAVRNVGEGASARPVFAGGENNLAVFAINAKTGEPTLIQHVETLGFEPRSFAIDPSGRILVAANQKALSVLEGGAVKPVAASLAVYRIGADGKLTYVAKHDVAGGEAFWLGIVKPPAR